ncbi:MAG: hypothetical protein ACI4JN_02480 [Ruminococcus sp.]
MKKCMIGIIVGAAFIVSGIRGFYYLQNERDMEIYNSHSMSFSNYQEEWITVVVNKLHIEDQQSCAEEIVEKCRMNNFKNIQFSYDLAIPNELRVSVYLSERDVKRHNEAFSFSYTQDELNGEYNIVEHPEKFKLQIDKDS